MTQRATRKRFETSQLTLSILVAALGVSACDNLVGEGPAGPTEKKKEPVGADDTEDPPAGVLDAGAPPAAPPMSQDDTNKNVPPPPASNPPDDKPVASLPCGQAGQKAKTALTTYCASCHGADSAGSGGFKTVLDVGALISGGKVIANKPSDSPLFKRMSGGTMPPTSVQKRPTDADLQAVEDWIACGAGPFDGQAVATYAFMDIDTRVSAVLSDLRSMPNVADRQRMRYFDLSALANAGYSKEQVQTYREAVSFLTNSLSQGRTVRAPEPIDDDELLLRIDLRDYGWDEDTWNLLEAQYPYAVVYDQDSRLFPYDEVTSEQIRRETGTNIPIIQGDWYISHASRPPLYHEVLELPATLQELEQQLGVDINEDIENEEVLRAGFRNAGPSQNHRIIERHELGGNRGALWVSYDFANNLNERNIFANPLDFQEDGGEMIFNLDNGLQGYFVADAAGTRLDKAPNNVVQDPASRDGAVENGLSCMTCHQEEGQLPKFDEIRDFVLTSGTSAEETEQVLALYVEREELEDAFDQDQNRYRSAREDLGIRSLGATTMHQLDDTHLSTMDINAVASVLGIETKELERALDATPQIFPPEIVSLRTDGGGVQRDAFEDVVDDLIEALGLGDQLLVNANGSINRGTNNNSGNGANRQNNR